MLCLPDDRCLLVWENSGGVCYYMTLEGEAGRFSLRDAATGNVWQPVSWLAGRPDTIACVASPPSLPPPAERPLKLAECRLPKGKITPVSPPGATYRGAYTSLHGSLGVIVGCRGCSAMVSDTELAVWRWGQWKERKTVVVRGPEQPMQRCWAGPVLVAVADDPLALGDPPGQITCVDCSTDRVWRWPAPAGLSVERMIAVKARD